MHEDQVQYLVGIHPDYADEVMSHFGEYASLPSIISVDTDTGVADIVSKYLRESDVKLTRDNDGGYHYHDPINKVEVYVVKFEDVLVATAEAPNHPVKISISV